jgi:diguanylate cyclase (GGDEF)-like protein/PAS domain S-box-containing protein
LNARIGSREVAVESSIGIGWGREDDVISSVLDLLPCALVITDPDGAATSVNRRWCDLTGQTEREWRGVGWLDVCRPADRTVARSALLADVRSGERHRADWVVSGGGGGRRTLHVHAAPEFEHGRLARNVATLTDVTDDRARVAGLLDRATRDSLTGLFNRAQFLEFLGHALDRRRRATERVVAVLFVDVDDLKAVNDGFGHEAGDQALRDVAERISAGVRPADVVARYGGDEFTVLCEDLHDAGEASAIAERIRESAAAHPRLGVTVGMAIASDRATEPASILAAADRAMYRAKRRHTVRGAGGDDMDVLAMAAHELRTPLMTIAGLASTLRAHRDRMAPANIEAAFGLLERQSERLAATFEQLLDLGRNHHDCPEPGPVDVASVVADALEAAPPPGHVTLKVADDHAAAPLIVAAERSTLTRVLVNVLTNAYRYGGPNVTIAAHNGAECVSLIVQDDGPGVPSALEVAMFTPFVSGGSGDARQPRGAGLGLALARQIAESFGGHLVHEPVQPHGARFILRLPAVPLSEPERRLAVSSRDGEGDRG